jgi:hypothetical protein
VWVKEMLGEPFMLGGYSYKACVEGVHSIRYTGRKVLNPWIKEGCDHLKELKGVQLHLGSRAKN